MPRLASLREPADRLLAAHGVPLPPANTPPALASRYRAVAFLAWRAEEFADLAGGWDAWGRVVAAGAGLATAVQLAESQFGGTAGAKARQRWAARPVARAQARHP